MRVLDIKSMMPEELRALMQEWGEPKFRAKQVFEWLHQKKVSSYQEMRNLPKALIQKMEQHSPLTVLQQRQRLVSQKDGTVKYLFALADGECIETVLMKYHYGYSVCISSQVGCRMGCAFCASTKAGYVRNLLPSEMLEQVYAAERDENIRISHIVLMGIGEPLDNFDNVVTFLQLINSPFGANISMRNLSVSTCGLVDRIDELAKLKLGITLSISLHACRDAVRSRMMPVNLRWNIDKLLQSCKNYSNITKRRISFEYALIQGENDSPEDAAQLAKVLKGQLCHVNLIPVNAVKETAYRQSGRKHVAAFQEELLRHGVNATVRRTLGSDINAACGQLRRDNLSKVE